MFFHRDNVHCDDFDLRKIALFLQDTIVTNDRWGQGCYCKHGGYYNCADKYTPGTLPDHKWEKCTSVDTASWGYRRNMKIFELLDLPTIIKVCLWWEGGLYCSQ